jgi:hypothetical protein
LTFGSASNAAWMFAAMVVGSPLYWIVPVVSLPSVSVKFWPSELKLEPPLLT